MSVYRLADLRYDHGALEPHVSGRVMELHHDKHHQSYVDGANETLERLADARRTDHADGADPVVVSALERALAFHVGGHLLHSVFWECLSPDGGGKPEGDLAGAIDEAFGSFDGLRREIDACMAGLQGSGWAVLSWEPIAQRLVVQQVTDHHGQAILATSPVLVLDGWEHAYYLDHQNDKAGWVDAFFEVVDWSAVAERFAGR